MLLLSMLSNMVASLRPFLSAQSRLLAAGQLEQLLEGVTIKTDLERVAESAGTHACSEHFLQRLQLAEGFKLTPYKKKLCFNPHWVSDLIEK